MSKRKKRNALSVVFDRFEDVGKGYDYRGNYLYFKRGKKRINGIVGRVYDDVADEVGFKGTDLKTDAPLVLEIVKFMRQNHPKYKRYTVFTSEGYRAVDEPKEDEK